MKKIAILLSLIVNIGGAQDNYLSFDGVDDYVAINGSSSNIANLTNSSFSFSVWAFPIGVPNEEVQGLNYGQIICRTGMHLGLGYSSGKYFDTLIWDKNGTASGVTAPDTYENSWYHLVFTYNSTTRSTGFYVDGDSIGSVTMEADIKNYSTDYIVGMGNTNLSSPHRYPFSGKIDELAIFSKVLATDEILELYKSGSGLNLTSDSGDYTSSSNLAGYWRFDEGTGTTVADASGNNNNGTIYRGATWKSKIVKRVPARFSTIQSAIDAASAGDTVLVADGTYTENLDIDKDIVIISENGAEKTIIDGGKIPHVIGFGSSTTRDCVLDGFTVTNGGGDDAGGIFVAEGSPILRNLIITGNRCEKWSGGGIDVIGEGANPLIEDCIITDNYATDSGGGLMVAQKATATINDVTINNNTAGGNGGGISVWGGSIKIKDTILDSNTSAYTLAMFVGTDDAVNFRPIIDIENVTVKNHRDANASNGQLLNFGSCSLSVNNLTLQDINVKGNSILLNNSKGIVSGLTVERDTSQNEIINISNGSKIDFYNLKISQSKTNDGNGLYITGNAVVKIDTLDIKDSYWGCSSGNCYGGTGESISVYNADFTLDNGKFSNIHAEGEGSALRADDGSRVEISNTLVDSSYSEGAGGGMVFYQSDYVSIKNSSFIANRSVNGGGGIHVNEVDSLFLYNSTFIADSSQGGGAVELGGGKYYHLDGNVMENNYSADGAGAINLWGNDKVEIFNSKFISNKSVNDGGAIYSWNTDSLFIDNSTFNGNESTDGNGGAMTFKGDANSTLYCEIKNTTFENNSGGWGGAIAAFEPIDMNIDSVFATGNEASGNGGFIELCCGASVSITNSTIYNNETNNNDLSVPSGCKMTIKNSIIWKDKIGVDTDATIEVTYSDVEGGFTGTGNINANPIFCDTINYLIRDTSPCVGTGENGSNMGAKGIGCYRPSSFDWVSTALDTINITQSNLADTYTLQWSESTDADGDALNYLLYVKIGVYPAEEIYDTTSTSVQITYEEFLENVFEPFPMLPGATVSFSVSVTDSIDTVKVTGDDRVLFVNRYEYLSTEGEGIPTEFALHENYPNPFNPTTTLRFDLPEVSDITLTIYNMLGQRVRTYNMNDTPAGYHSIKWNATNDYGDPVGAGVYLYQLRANQYVKTRKMVLLK